MTNEDRNSLELETAKGLYRKAISQCISELLSLRNVAKEPKVAKLLRARSDIAIISKEVKELDQYLKKVYDLYTFQLEIERDKMESCDD